MRGSNDGSNRSSSGRRKKQVSMLPKKAQAPALALRSGSGFLTSKRSSLNCSRVVLCTCIKEDLLALVSMLLTFQLCLVIIS